MEQVHDHHWRLLGLRSSSYPTKLSSKSSENNSFHKFQSSVSYDKVIGSLK